EVAPVCDRYAQIAQRAAERVAARAAGAIQRPRQGQGLGAARVADPDDPFGHVSSLMGAPGETGAYHSPAMNMDAARRISSIPGKEPLPALAVAVVMERKTLANRWRSDVWQPIGVVPDSDAAGAPR